MVGSITMRAFSIAFQRCTKPSFDMLYGLFKVFAMRFENAARIRSLEMLVVSGNLNNGRPSFVFVRPLAERHPIATTDRQNATSAQNCNRFKRFVVYENITFMR